jgi:steroid delta-isomerase-like uncharacterized protein
MPTTSTKIAPEQLVQAAKASIIAYNNKDWKAARASLTPNVVYDEVATQRKVQGVDEVLALWKGWAAAFPDSKATFHSAEVSGNTVVIELTWKGTHTGSLETPDGPVAATGKKIDMRACQVIEMAGEKAQSCRQYFDMATMMQQLGLTS